jgi:ABC-type branched-subunit amino acid transport system ATPase component
MTTLAFGQMLFFAFHDTPLGGGSDGLFIPRPFLGWAVSRAVRPAVFLLLNLGVLVAVYAGLCWLMRTMLGHALQGIRSNENRMAALGHDVQRLKLIAFVLSGALAGLAGHMSTLTDGFVTPDLLGWHRSAEGLLMILLGGIGALHGPILGAFALTAIQEAGTLLTDRPRLVEGTVFLAAVLFLRHGLAGWRLGFGSGRLPSWLGAFGLPVAVRAGVGGPDTPSHDGDGSGGPSSLHAENLTSFPSSWSGGPVAVGAGIGGPDKPGHDEEVSNAAYPSSLHAENLTSFPSSWSGVPVAVRAGIGGPDTPGHDEEVNNAAYPSSLHAENLTKRFGGLLAVDDVTLSLKSGILHAVIGPNGAGKSTLVNLLSGEVPLSSGRVSLNDSDISQWPAWKRGKAGIGRTFQRTNIMRDMSVLENTRLAAQARSCIGLSNLAFSENLVQSALVALHRTGLGGVSGTIAGTLSHGQARLLEIAMALAGAPTVLLLDEPLAGLGPEETAPVAALLRDLAGDHAVLLVEHDMDVVFAVADLITVMVDGRVLATGTPDQVRGSAVVRDAYLGHGV